MKRTLSKNRSKPEFKIFDVGTGLWMLTREDKTSRLLFSFVFLPHVWLEYCGKVARPPVKQEFWRIYASQGMHYVMQQ